MNDRTTGIDADAQLSIGRYRYPPILASIGLTLSTSVNAINTDSITITKCIPLSIFL